jgi:hypothetical protein
MLVCNPQILRTCFAFWMVALGLLWRRGYVHGATRPATAAILLLHLLVIVGACIGEAAAARQLSCLSCRLR